MSKWVIIGPLALLLVAHLAIRIRVVKLLRKLQMANVQIRPTRLYNREYRYEQLSKFPNHADTIVELHKNLVYSIVVLAAIIIVAISAYIL